MKNHKFANLIIFATLAGGLTSAGGCAVDARTGKPLADAIAAGPVRDYASAQAGTLAETSQLIDQQAAPSDGSAPDLDAARISWRKARAAYDRGVAVYVVVAPELDFALDGAFDDALASTGLRYLERALFSTPPAAPGEVARLTHALRTDARALHGAVPDAARPMQAAD